MRIHSLLPKLSNLPSGVYLGVATVIFAASNAFTRKVIEIGSNNPINGHNPISPCNVLFVGNLCAFGLMLPLFYQQCRPSVLRHLSKKDWGGMVIVAALGGALVPGLIFTALELTSVANVVLLGRLETPLTLFFSVFLLGAGVNVWTIAGAIFALMGVALTLLLDPTMPLSNPPQMLIVGRGEILTLLSALIGALATVLSKAGLQAVPVGFFSLFRNAMGAIIFFFLAIALYGSDHFQEATAPFLWGWMVIYALVIVVIGQLAWFTGLKTASVGLVALVDACSPLVAIFIAFILLGEVPSRAQYIGGTIIFMGILLSLRGTLTSAPSTIGPVTPGRLLSFLPGFKGV